MARGDEEGELLTPAAHSQLQSELAELEGPKRREAVQAIATARAHGDLSENFEYHAAKNEQGLLEARIRVLRHRLQHATIIDEAEVAASGVVTVGSKVELERDDGGSSRSRSRAWAASRPTLPSAGRCWGRLPATRSRWTHRAAAGGRGSCPSGVPVDSPPVSAVPVDCG